MAEIASSVNECIAAQVRRLRSVQGWSLQALAQRSGISRSMISVIERGESSATASVLDRLAAALGVPLASLFQSSDVAASPLVRASEQTTWRDPGSGYSRRNLSPPGCDSPLQLVEISFPAGTRVAYDTSVRAARVHQQIWVLDGGLEVAVGDVVHRLNAGDCLAFEVDRPTAFYNPTRKVTRYLVAVASGAARRPMNL
jgi:transcriptional regulator with XRE-family HTH domain